MVGRLWLADCGSTYLASVVEEEWTLAVAVEADGEAGLARGAVVLDDVETRSGAEVDVLADGGALEGGVVDDVLVHEEVGGGVEESAVDDEFVVVVDLVEVEEASSFGLGGQVLEHGLVQCQCRRLRVRVEDLRGVRVLGVVGGGGGGHLRVGVCVVVMDMMIMLVVLLLLVVAGVIVGVVRSARRVVVERDVVRGVEVVFVVDVGWGVVG